MTNIITKKVKDLRKIVNFSIEEDMVTSNGKNYLFFRFTPPNMNILTDAEVEDEIDNFATLMDMLNRQIMIFATDKVENLDIIKKFYVDLPTDRADIVSDIVATIDSTEVESASVQRAFYFVYKSETGKDDISHLIIGRGFNVERALKPELTILTRNYHAREFVTTQVHTMEEEIMCLPGMQKILAKKGKQSAQLKKAFAEEMYRRITPARVDFGIRYSEQSGCFRKTLMIKNLPSDIPPLALKTVAAIRGTSMTMRITPMSKNNMSTLVNRQINSKLVGMGSRKATKQMEAGQESQVIQDFYKSILKDKNCIFYVNVFIEMYGKTIEQLKSVEEKVTIEITARSATYDLKGHEQLEAFVSVNPLGDEMFFAGANNLPSPSLAALYPMSHSSRLDVRGMLLGTTVDGGSMFMDMWLRNKHITNSNITVTGTSGQGKTYLMKKILLFQYLIGTSIFLLDPENEYIDLFAELGGTVVNCIDGSAIINPFQVRALKTKEDVGDSDDDIVHIDPNVSIFFQHLSWLEDFMATLFPELSSMAIKSLMYLVREMYAHHGVSHMTVFENMRNEDYPTFTDLHNYIDTLDAESYGKYVSEDNLRDIRLCVLDCHEGQLKPIFNGHTNIKNSEMMCFAMNDFLQGSQSRTQAVLFNISTYVWNIITQRKNRVILGLDELYLFLNNFTMVKYLQSFSKRARKYEASLLVGTQQLGDCLGERYYEFTASIFNNSSFNFLFYPEKIDLELTRQRLKLTGGEIKSISKSNKEHCLLMAGNDRYYMRVGTLPYEEALFGTAGGR